MIMDGQIIFKQVVILEVQDHVLIQNVNPTSQTQRDNKKTIKD